MEPSNSESEENNLSESENQSVEEKQELVPEYERKRQMRIQENNKRMESLGLSKIASSFMGSVQKAKKNKNDKKGKKKKVDEDEEYNPIEDDEEKSVSSEEEEKDSDFIVSGKKKGKRNTPTPKKRGPTKKLKFDSDYVDDDDALLQAIALSLGFSDVKSSSDQSSGTHLRTSTNCKASASCNTDIPNDNSGRKRKKSITSRVQMSEDEIILHFFQFDEADKGGISVRDIERLAIAHDFTWSDKEMNDMIYCLDSDGDGKISLDDFRKIVSRINMVKCSDNDTTGELIFCTKLGLWFLGYHFVEDP